MKFQRCGLAVFCITAILALSWFVVTPPCAPVVNPYYGLGYDTTTGTATQRVSGRFFVAADTQTYTTPIVDIGNRNGLVISTVTTVTNSSATFAGGGGVKVTYGLTAGTGTFTGNVTASSVSATGNAVVGGSMTASSFWGDGAHLTGISSTDAWKSILDAHTMSQSTHDATNEATASRMVVRDAGGGAAFAGLTTSSLTVSGSTLLGDLGLNPAAAPGAQKGRLYFDSATNQVKVSTDGVGFVSISTGAGVGHIVSTRNANGAVLGYPARGNLIFDGFFTILDSPTVNGSVVQFSSAGLEGAWVGITRQVFASGSGTYTKPTNPMPAQIRIRMVGGGGGGGAVTDNAGSAGSPTSFGAVEVHGGSGGGIYTPNGGPGADGGTGGSGAASVVIAGTPGSAGAYAYTGGIGGNSQLGAGGRNYATNSAGGAGGSYGGGGAGGVAGATGSGGGGGGGEYKELIIDSPGASYAYAVGAGGAGGAAGTQAGGAGAGGAIFVDEYYHPVIASGGIASNGPNTFTDVNVFASSLTASSFWGNGAGLTDVTPKDGSVTTDKLGSGAVTAPKVNFNYAASASAAGPASSIADGTATTDKLGAGSVTVSKLNFNYAASATPAGPASSIADGTATTDKVGSGAITESKLGSTLGTNINTLGVSTKTLEVWINSTGTALSAETASRILADYDIGASTKATNIILAQVGVDTKAISVIIVQVGVDTQTLRTDFVEADYAIGVSTKATNTILYQVGVDTAALAAGTGLVDGAVTTLKLGGGSVTAEKVNFNYAASASAAGPASSIADGTATTDKLGSGAVTESKLSAGAVTTTPLASGAVTSPKLAADAVTSVAILAGAVSTDKLAADSVTGVKILAGAVTTNKLASGAVTSPALNLTAQSCGAGQYGKSMSASGAWTCDTPAGSGDVTASASNNFNGPGTVQTFGSSVTLSGRVDGLVKIASTTAFQLTNNNQVANVCAAGSTTTLYGATVNDNLLVTVSGYWSFGGADRTISATLVFNSAYTVEGAGPMVSRINTSTSYSESFGISRLLKAAEGTNTICLAVKGDSVTNWNISGTVVNVVNLRQ